MTNTTTLSSFQAAQTDDEQQPESKGNYLSEFAQKMLRERGEEAPHVGDPFEGMSLDVDPADAFGLVEGQVRSWLSEAGRWATEIEIKHRTDRLMAEAQNARPGPVTSEARYSVAPDGTVIDYQPIEAEAELPEMPAHGLRVPKSTEFDADGWADSTALYQRAQALIERHPDELEHLEGMTLSFLWKLKGGKSRGRPVYGQCVKTGGLLKHFATSTFAIWLAADHVLAAGYRDREIEALLFRQLLAAGVAEVDENTGRGGGATLVPPDVQAYAAELRVYGLWESTLKSAAQAFSQAPLFGASADTEIHDIQNPYMDEASASGSDSDASNERPKQAVSSDDGAGVLIHDDGTPMTPEEVAGQEAAELRDDPAEFEDGYPRESDLKCSVCGEAMLIESAAQDHEIAQAMAAGMPPVMLCEACGEDDAEPGA
jgi:hypothetical protein